MTSLGQRKKMNETWKTIPLGNENINIIYESHQPSPNNHPLGLIPILCFRSKNGL